MAEERVDRFLNYIKEIIQSESIGEDIEENLIEPQGVLNIAIVGQKLN
jgi:hypothetical protein